MYIRSAVEHRIIPWHFVRGVNFYNFTTVIMKNTDLFPIARTERRVVTQRIPFLRRSFQLFEKYFQRSGSLFYSGGERDRPINQNTVIESQRRHFTREDEEEYGIYLA